MLNSLDPVVTQTNLDLLNLDPLTPETRVRLLRFPLGFEDSILLPLEQITEIIRVNLPDVLLVPEMPSCILGIGNWRSEMLWLVDLNQLLGYPPLSEQGQVSLSPVAIVVQVNDQSVGLVVSQVNDIELHELEQLQPPASGLFPPRLLPFVLGYLPGNGGAVLDVTAITQCPLWQTHQAGESWGGES
ncbi:MULTISPECIES: chemotaxis protein CheW [Moorena]|uniref:Chemotaxis signal transduction protein n=1 Tax=Moorena producens 3L TaxID=489825 RepID=F4XZC2_9CYAN|nr:MULTISPECIES: chemotaxis protein CheW [Moorena]NEQ15572.1 chemotaxis protein CheW [Moorena sp. SIO3E2]EGJ30065.1 chemotaxis signal transduction protein [Moorena producens 3L]NEP34911.1 chemotaxis protein CheW [Moorena sp. SIO3B2]NEP67137.1 chemotaxis protein CheW [Moorena sp. SIO3A5]NEQ06487.1 chemotaxis protein CheW [Moorena sp. SIO4E2]